MDSCSIAGSVALKGFLQCLDGCFLSLSLFVMLELFSISLSIVDLELEHPLSDY